jgi:hypothetical protein
MLRSCKLSSGGRSNTSLSTTQCRAMGWLICSALTNNLVEYLRRIAQTGKKKQSSCCIHTRASRQSPGSTLGTCAASTLGRAHTAGVGGEHPEPRRGPRYPTLPQCSSVVLPFGLTGRPSRPYARIPTRPVVPMCACIRIFPHKRTYRPDDVGERTCVYTSGRGMVWAWLVGVPGADTLERVHR